MNSIAAETSLPPTFIRAAEMWVPSEDGSILEFGAGAFGAAKRFAGLSRSMCFGRGEGLPGRAWDEGKPILLREFDSVNFHRTAAARDAGLSSAIAMPIFVGGVLKAVVVLFCSQSGTSPTALELWHSDPSVSTDVTLVDGAYGAALQAFESASRDTAFKRGSGLPGLAMQRGEAHFIADLSDSQGRFARSEQAGKAGIQNGLAVPVGSRSDGPFVATFLSSSDAPMARAVELWTPDSTKTKLVCSYSFGASQRGSESVPSSKIEQAFASGMPGIDETPMPFVAMPVIWGGSLIRGVVALYL